MSLQVEAVYEDGVFKPDRPVPLGEHSRVLIEVKPTVSRIRQSAESLHWKGDPTVLRQIAEDPDLRIGGEPAAEAQ